MAKSPSEGEARMKKKREKTGGWDEEPLLPQLTVYEPEQQPTGLLDAEGRPLYRQRERMGFIR